MSRWAWLTKALTRTAWTGVPKWRLGTALNDDDFWDRLKKTVYVLTVGNHRLHHVHRNPLSTRSSPTPPSL